ncbi:cyclic nucleotide-binding protein [Magnetococcus marinus MC-1]|uniref:Cyclic nucleotide-binding protein n=1 Tax=Magnetococcus marinus (strain ATCC BAA-1437 / JCM 17883 / MC-1) TaxID=156889 RepID=A0L467_MAGMM|nr:diguanylate cyclase [Magnetococcus marinus]ABK42760.1 cyclic nucleotide-binding protein [Magnetococcus marinus MC-1]
MAVVAHYAGEHYAEQILFRNIHWEELASVLCTCPVKSMQPGEVLLDPKHPNETIYLVIEGRLSIHLKDLETPPIASIGQGSFVGELSIMDEKYPTAFVVVEHPSQLLMLSRVHLKQLIDCSSTFVFNLLQVFSHRMRFSTEALIESHFVRTVPDIIYRLDAQGHFIYLNESIEKLGYTMQELLSQHFSVLVSVEDLDSVSFDSVVVRHPQATPSSGTGVQPKLFDERRSGDRKTTGLELKLCTRDTESTQRSIIHAEVSCTGIQVESLVSGVRDYHGTIGIIRDVTERKQFMTQLSEQKAQMEAIFNTIADALLVTDVYGIIQSANHSASEIFGYSQGELLGCSIGMLLEAEQHEDAVVSRWTALAGHRKEVKVRRKGEQIFEAEMSVSQVFLEDRILYTGIIRDITERKEAERRITYQANYDALTGIPNRSYFQQLLNQSIQRAAAEGKRLAIIFIDLDRFKWVNDNLGHGAGDELLRLSSKRAASCLKGRDTVARLGGDEFVAILEHVGDTEQAFAVSKRVLESLNRPFMLDGKEVYISGSMGVAIYPQDATQPEELLTRADEAMYCSKRAGRNACHFVTGESFQMEKKY